MSGPAATSPSGSPQIASMRIPITRPRMSSLEVRSMTAASGSMQKLCTNPATKSSASPSGSERVWPKIRIARNQAAVFHSMTRPARSGAWLALTGSLTVGKYYLQGGKLRYRSSRSEGAATVSEEHGKTYLTVIPEGPSYETGKTEYERVK